MYKTSPEYEIYFSFPEQTIKTIVSCTRAGRHLHEDALSLILHMQQLWVKDQSIKQESDK